MLSEIFYWVLNMSFVGSIMWLIVLCLRKIKILPRFAVYSLWNVVLIRLVVPFGMINEYSLMSLISKFTTRTVVIREKIDAMPQLTMTNSIMAAESYFPIVYKTNLLKDIFRVVAVVWIVIALAITIAVVLLYIFTKAEMKSAIHIEKNVYQSDKISTPTVYDILNPKIILPMNISENNLYYITTHENVHIKRKDNLFRAGAITTFRIELSAYKFGNPPYFDSPNEVLYKAYQNCWIPNDGYAELTIQKVSDTKVKLFGAEWVKGNLQPTLDYGLLKIKDGLLVPEAKNYPFEEWTIR